MMSHIESRDESRDKSLYESRDESHAPNSPVLVTSNQNRFRQEEEGEAAEAAGEDDCSQVITIRRLELCPESP